MYLKVWNIKHLIQDCLSQNLLKVVYTLVSIIHWKRSSAKLKTITTFNNNNITFWNISTHFVSTIQCFLNSCLEWLCLVTSSVWISQMMAVCCHVWMYDSAALWQWILNNMVINAREQTPNYSDNRFILIFLISLISAELLWIMHNLASWGKSSLGK